MCRPTRLSGSTASERGRPAWNGAWWRRALRVGNRFRYDIRVSWMEGGRAVERQRHLSFRAGDRVVLDFAPSARLNPPQDILIDPAAPAPWRMNYYENPSNWPDYPNRWRWYGHYPVSPITPR